MELVEFLLARFAEDLAAATGEAIARASAGTVALGPAYYDHPGREAMRAQLQEAVIDGRRTRPWSSPWDPARVLAECEAKRQLVEDAKLAQEAYAALRDSLSGDTERERVELRAYGQDAFVWWGVLLQLALPYADHPDYRPEWKP